MKSFWNPMKTIEHDIKEKSMWGTSYSLCLLIPKDAGLDLPDTNDDDDDDCFRNRMIYGVL